MRAILTYHSIDPSGSAISVAAEEFAAHVRWLASGQVTVVSLDQLIQLGDGSDAVALTFDDGFLNFAAAAAPALLDHGLPATVFIVTGHVGKTNAWRGRKSDQLPELPLLDWDALGRLKDQGIGLGAHTRTHPSLPSLSGQALADEIEGSGNDLRERLGIAVSSFAYPYGSVSPAAASLTRQAYQSGVTTELRALRPGDANHLLPRLDMYYYRTPGRLERWGTPAFRRHLWLRAELRRARAALAGMS